MMYPTGEIVRSTGIAPAWVAVVLGYVGGQGFGSALFPAAWRGINAPLPSAPVPVTNDFLVFADRALDDWQLVVRVTP